MHEEIRDRVFKRISALEKGYRQNLALLGPSGIGKTTLLQSLFQSLCGQQHLIPIYINAPSVDADLLIDKWLEAMLRGVFLSQAVIPPSQIESLITAAAPVIPKTIEKVRNLRRQMRKERNASLARELFSCTGVLSQETGKKIILIIDEFQHLNMLPAADPFASLGKEIMTEKDTIYVVSSSDTRKALEIIQEKLSLLFSNFEMIRVPCLSSQETIAFLDAELSHVVWPLSVQRFLFYLTGGHPSYLQMIAKRLRKSNFLKPVTFSEYGQTESRSLSITASDFMDFFETEVHEPSGVFYLLFDRKVDVLRLSKDGPGCLRALFSLSAGPSKAAELAEQMCVKVAEVKKYLSRLVECGFVEKSGLHFFINDHFFAFWLREVSVQGQSLRHPGHENEQLFIANCEQLVSSLESAAESTLESMLTTLLLAFRNDTLEFQSRKIICPNFSEIVVRPGSGKRPLLEARAPKNRFVFQIFDSYVTEDDVLIFNQDVKSLSRQRFKKSLFALCGIDQNAKLMAHEYGVQLFDLQDLNFMQHIHKITETVIISKRENNEETVGAMAQGLYSA